MRFQRVGEPGAEIPCVSIDGVSFDITPVTRDIDGEFVHRLTVEREAVQREIEDLIAAEKIISLPDVPSPRVAPPLARPPALLCIGRNYEAHARETGSEPPENPIVFLKHPSSISGPNDPILRPPERDTLDWEVELAVVIGKRARYLSSVEAAAEVIAGYTVAIDVSERKNQKVLSGGQWSKGKSGESFCPLGPEFVTADEVDPDDLRLWAKVNGMTRQEDNSSLMIFPVTELVRDLSQFMVLEPGDIILSGTPEGVALSGRYEYLVPGDVVEVGIDGLGEQHHTVKQVTV